MTAAAHTTVGLVLAGCAAYAFSSPLSAVIVRARWAWRCRGAPVRSEVAPLEQWEREELITILRGWKRPAPAEEPDVKALATVLWVLAWCSVSVAVAAAWAAVRGHGRARAVAPAAAILAAGLAWAGAVLW